jgi:hypothetical protein
VSRSERARAGRRTGFSSGSAFGARIALRTSIAAGALLALGSCLVPQDVDPINTRVHTPPRIVVESIPSQLVVPYLTLTRVTRDTGCRCELTLSVPAVEENDPTIDLEARWFVDYDVRVPTSEKLATFSEMNGSFDFGATVRSGPSFTFDPDALGGDGFHTVEVVIAEATGFLANDDPQATLPFRTLKTDYSAANYRFFVQVVTDNNAAQCPQTALLTRVCSQ